MKIVKNRIDFLIEVSKFLPKNNTCIEIGVCEGLFSKEILTYLEPKQLFLVDPWNEGHDKNANITHYIGPEWQRDVWWPTAYSNESQLLKIKEIYSKEIENNQIIIKREFSYEAASIFPDDFFDFIYIDACHLYESVRSDLNDYLPKLKKTGLMCGHDYMKICSFGEIGVIEAVDEFIINNKFKWLVKNDGGENENGGDWAIAHEDII